tara:strand:- start:1336 stop:3090 length:1755 start_codon:yes stop_codon:yes gene_type:complete
MQKSRRFIFFNPQPLSWSSYLPYIKLGKDIANLGHKITFLNCKSSLEGSCPTHWSAFHSVNLKKDKKDNLKNLCTKCIFYQKKISSIDNNFSSINLEDFTNVSVKTACSKLIKKLSNKPIEKIINFKIENIPLGKFAAYELLLSFKKKNLNFDANQQKIYLKSLKKSIFLFFIIKKLINNFFFTDVIVNNSSYSMNRIMMSLCRKYKKNVYNFEHGDHFGNRLSLLEFTKFSSTINHSYFLKNKIWPHLKNKNTLTKKSLSLVFEHFNSVFDKKLYMTFSKKPERNFNIIDKLKISKSQKIILLVTSSADEGFANKTVGNRYPKKKLFKTNIDWLKFTLNFAKKNPKLFFILRIHPRLMPSKRNPLNSEEINNFKKIFNNQLPKNIFVNWPSQNISLYNFLPYSDVVLTEGSSVTLEALLFGLPVLTCSEEYSVVPNDLVVISRNKSQYVENIKKNLNKSIQISKILKTINWIALKLVSSKINNLKSYNLHESLINKFFNKFFRYIFLSYNILIINKINQKNLHLKKILDTNSKSPAEIINVSDFANDNMKNVKKLVKKKIFSILNSIHFNFNIRSKISKYYKF